MQSRHGGIYSRQGAKGERKRISPQDTEFSQRSKYLLIKNSTLGVLCTSAVIELSCGSIRFVSIDFHRVDHHRIYRHILVHAAVTGFYFFNRMHDVHAFDDLTEDRVAITAGRSIFVIQKIIVLNVDKKLRRGAVNHVGPRHGDAALDVLETIVGFVFDRRLGWSLTHLRIEAAALNHETRDNPMKNQPIEMSVVYIS